MSGEISIGDAKYALDIVKSVCAKAGPGVPGSSQERERAVLIEKELESHLGSGNVTLEDFTFAPAAMLGSQLISTILMLIAALLNISVRRIAGFSPGVSSVIGLILSISAVLLFILEFLIGIELIDPLFKQGSSVNVVGNLRRHGTQKIKRLLILSGHHDSASEFFWLRHTGYGFLVLAITYPIGLLTVFVLCAIQLAGVISSQADIVRSGTIGWIPLVYPIIPSITFALLFSRPAKNGGTVPGAADNLSACALVVAMSRFLAKNPSYVPEDTEIRFITFGSEEAGVRGSKRYVEKHMDELVNLDARLLNYETMVNPQIVILTSESNGTVKNSPVMVKSLVAAAQRAQVPYSVRPATLGTGSDAGPFSQAGLKAGTLLGFNVQQMVRFYHQDRDTPDVLNIEALLNVLKLTFEWIRRGGE